MQFHRTFICISMLCSVQMLYGHQEYVHQHMVKQAYLLLRNQLGYDIPQLHDHLGLSSQGPGSGTWVHQNVVIGAWREDVDDPVWNVGGGNLGGIECGFTASSTHFWDADAGDLSTIDIPSDWGQCPAGGTIPNAYQKALLYAYGYWWLGYAPGTNTLTLGSPNGHTYRFEKRVLEAPLSIPFHYRSLADLLRTRTMYVDYGGAPILNYRIFDVTLGRYVSYTGSLYVTDQMSDEFVWEIVGRLAHLLGDMSVPAHTHNDVHPCWIHFGIPGINVHIENGDSYELWSGGSVHGNANSCNDPVTSVPAYNISWSDALALGGYINVVGKENPLRYLFYTLNQAADHFGSLTTSPAPDFDNMSWYPGDNAYSPNSGSDYYAELVNLINYLGPPIINQSDFPGTLAQANTVVFATSIRAVAGLLYWFAVEADLINRVIVKNDFNGGAVSVNLRGYSGSFSSGSSFNGVLGDPITIATQTPTSFGGYVRHFAEWQRIDRDGLTILQRYFSAAWSTILSGSHTFNAVFNREFTIALSVGQSFEGSIGGTYRVNYGSPVASWSGAFVERVSSPIHIEAIPPSSDWVFVRWSDGSTQNPRDFTPTDHANIRALYKQRLTSSVLTASAYNTQRKVGGVGVGPVHAVYESGGQIWYTRNDGSGWINERIISDFPFQTTAKNPSIAVTYPGGGTYFDVHVAWEVVVSNSGNEYHQVWYRRSTNTGTTWEPQILLSSTGVFLNAVNVDATPVLDGSPIAVVWKYGSATDGGLVMKVEPTNNQAYYFIPNTNWSSRFPTIDGQIGCKIAYEHGPGFIMYWEFSIGGAPNYSITPIGTGPTGISNEYFWMHNSTKPSISVSHPYVFVSWEADRDAMAAEEEQSIVDPHRVFVRAYTPWTDWTPVTEFDHYGHGENSSSTGMNGTTSKANAVWQCGGHLAKASRDISGVQWSSISDLGTGSHPSLTRYAYPLPPYLMYTVGSTPPYTVSLSSSFTNLNDNGEIEIASGKNGTQNNFSLLDGGNINRGASVCFDSISVGGSRRGALRGNLYVENTSFEIRRGTTREPILFDADTMNFAEWLGTVTIEVPQDADRITGRIKLSLQNFTAPTSIPMGTKVLSTIIDIQDSPRQLVKSISLSDLRKFSGRDTTVLIPISISAHSLRGKSLRIIQRLIGQDEGQAPRWSELLRVDSASSNNTQMTSSAKVLMDSPLPTVLAVHDAYPNPFNPSAMIKFDSPEPSHVSLFIYDILGRKVAELENGMKGAGYHFSIWNATNVASGVYFARFTATDAQGKLKLSKVNKLLLAK